MCRGCGCNWSVEGVGVWGCGGSGYVGGGGGGLEI